MRVRYAKRRNQGGELQNSLFKKPREAKEKARMKIKEQAPSPNSEEVKVRDFFRARSPESYELVSKWVLKSFIFTGTGDWRLCVKSNAFKLFFNHEKKKIFRGAEPLAENTAAKVLLREFPETKNTRKSIPGIPLIYYYAGLVPSGPALEFFSQYDLMEEFVKEELHPSGIPFTLEQLLEAYGRKTSPEQNLYSFKPVFEALLKQYHGKRLHPKGEGFLVSATKEFLKFLPEFQEIAPLVEGRFQPSPKPRGLLELWELTEGTEEQDTPRNRWIFSLILFHLFPEAEVIYNENKVPYAIHLEPLPLPEEEEEEEPATPHWPLNWQSLSCDSLNFTAPGEEPVPSLIAIEGSSPITILMEQEEYEKFVTSNSPNKPAREELTASSPFDIEITVELPPFLFGKGEDDPHFSVDHFLNLDD